MKKQILILVSLIFSIGVFAQDAYTAKMKENLQKFDSAKTIADFRSVANSFELIGKMEKDKWLPFYYAAYTKIIINYIDENKDNKDPILDQAEAMIDTIMNRFKNNSEIYTLKGYLYQARISIDPMSRGQKYSALANEMFAKAKELDPSNPRPHYLMGQNLYYTPKMFGGGSKNALPHLLKAKELFDTFKIETEISPDWGKERTEMLLKECEGKSGKKNKKKN